MHPIETTSRRDFLKTSTTVAAGAALAGGLSLARSAHAAGGDEIKIALVGCGGRGTGAADQCLSVDKTIKLVALADLFENRLQGALKNLKKQRGPQIDVPPERQFVGFDAYQKAIDAGADVVLLATPPGFRPTHYAAAIAAGKHAFMEKPCCVDAPGFRLLMETNKLADEKGLKVAVGVQRRHSNEYRPKIQQIHDGDLGDLLLLRAYWNGSFFCGGFEKRGTAPEMEFQIRNWNVFRWLSGDHIVEQHVHNLDVCNWAKQGHPVEANGMGGRASRKNAQIFDHHMVEFIYADGCRLLSECRQMPGCWDQVSEAVTGTKGTMLLKTNGNDGYVAEHRDLVNAIRNGTKLNDGWHGATSSMTAVLGRMATYSGQKVTWAEAVAKGPNEGPATLALDANPPQMPEADGTYPVPVPGVYKPY
jgi:myo-inositol 2-dehydrogenase / D-chiro-inositol 1-dehydrogenase